jgi:membrane protease YdiL (CAAX protease family)
MIGSVSSDSAESTDLRPPAFKRLALALIITLVVAFATWLVMPPVRGFWVIGLAVGTTAAWLVLWRVEKLPLGDMGMRRRGMLRDLALGFAVGTSVVLLEFLFGVVFGHYRIEGFNFRPGVQGAALVFLLVVALWEETFFRGIIFRILTERLGLWPALLLGCALFASIHLPNPGVTLVGLGFLFLDGIWFTGAFVISRALWFPIGIHWALNVMSGPVLFGSLPGSKGGDTLVIATAPESATGTTMIIGWVVNIVLAGAALLLMARVRRAQPPAMRWSPGGGWAPLTQQGSD